MECEIAAAFTLFPPGNSNLPLVAGVEGSQDEPAKVEQLASIVLQGTRCWGVSEHNCLMLLCVITNEIQIRTMAMQYSDSCISTPTGAVVGAGKKRDMAFLMKMEYSTYINI